MAASHKATWGHRAVTIPWGWHNILISAGQPSESSPFHDGKSCSEGRAAWCRCWRLVRELAAADLWASCVQEAVEEGARLFHSFVAELDARISSSPSVLDARVSTERQSAALHAGLGAAAAVRPFSACLKQQAFELLLDWFKAVSGLLTCP